MDLTGYLIINAKDVWTEYGAFLAETSREAHTNMDALLRMPKAKDITMVDFRERDGVKLPDAPLMKLESIDRTLQFCIIAGSEAERLKRYRELLVLLTSGKLSMQVKGYRTYRMIYKDMPSEPQWFNPHAGPYRVVFSVKFTDYAPEAG